MMKMTDINTGFNEVIAFVGTVGGNNSEIINLLESTGFQRKEEFGALVFTAPLNILGKVTENLIWALEQYQLEHRLVVMIVSSALTTFSEKDRLEAFKWWEVSDEFDVVAVYDLRHDLKNIRGGLASALGKVGAGVIFDSCRSIFRTDLVNTDDLRNRLKNLAEESNQDPKMNKRTGEAIQYHADVFHGHILGTPRVLDDWKEYKVKMFFEKFQRMRDQLIAWNNEIREIPEALNPYELEDALDTVNSAISTVRRLKKDFAGLLEFQEIYEKLGLTDVIVTNTYTPAKSVQERLGNYGDAEFTGTIIDVIEVVDRMLDEVLDFALETKAHLKEQKEELRGNDNDGNGGRNSRNSRKLRLLASTLTEKRKQTSLTSFF